MRRWARARWRSGSERPSSSRGERVIPVGGGTVDVERGLFVRDGVETALTTKEAALLAHLAAHAGEVVSRDALLREVWGWKASGSTRSVDICVRRLRQKIETDP